MKILYLILLYNGEINGGHTYRMATATALRNVVGGDNLDIVLSELDNSDWGCNVVMRMKNYSSMSDKLKNLISGNITQRSNKVIDEIVNLINNNKYDIVLFGSSETGKLIKEVKKRCQVKTITWYHDVVADVITKKRKNSFNLFRRMMWKVEENSEKTDAELTDFAIVLHERDAALLKKYWNRKADMYIPIVLADRFEKNTLICQSDKNKPLELLFVGAYNWSVNVEAVYWFCENVMTRLEEYPVNFNIAGFKMEKLIEDGKITLYKNVKVLGTVDNLAETYREADLVVEPILTGSGMKVKTAEALMHGKEIIGTYEALVGYDELSKYVCESADDFVQKIIYYCNNRPYKFVEANRKAYECKYSIQALENKLQDVLDMVMHK